MRATEHNAYCNYTIAHYVGKKGWQVIRHNSIKTPVLSKQSEMRMRMRRFVVALSLSFSDVIAWERAYTCNGHQSHKGRENIPVAGTNRARGESILLPVGGARERERACELPLQARVGGPPLGDHLHAVGQAEEPGQVALLQNTRGGYETQEATIDGYKTREAITEHKRRLQNTRGGYKTQEAVTKHKRRLRKHLLQGEVSALVEMADQIDHILAVQLLVHRHREGVV
eukprot:1194999-Prorocentrum_minimum.AAC.11